MRRVSFAVAFAVQACLAAPALAQAGAPAPLPQTPEGRAIDAAAEALGMVRTVSIATGRTTNKGIIAIRYTAKGMLQEGRTKYQVVNVVADFAHYLPASRVDWELVGPNGQKTRRIEVVRDKQAWNETTPGMGATAAPNEATRRLRQLWLTPHAAIWAAIDAQDRVTMSTVNGKTVLRFPSPLDNAPMQIVLGADRRPEQIQVQDGAQSLIVEYSDYKDLEVYEVFFPHKIVQRRGGQVVMDLTVAEGHSNPYLAFPIPAVAAR